MYLLYKAFFKTLLVRECQTVDKYWQMSFSRHVSISSSHLGASASLMFCHMKSRNIEAWYSRPSLWKWRSAKRKKGMKTKEAGEGSCYLLSLTGSWWFLSLGLNLSRSCMGRLLPSPLITCNERQSQV